MCVILLQNNLFGFEIFSVRQKRQICRKEGLKIVTSPTFPDTIQVNTTCVEMHVRCAGVSNFNVDLRGHHMCASLHCMLMHLMCVFVVCLCVRAFVCVCMCVCVCVCVCVRDWLSVSLSIIYLSIYLSNVQLYITLFR